MFVIASFLLLSWHNFVPVQGLVFPQPQRTDLTTDLLGWTPKPTERPQARAAILGAVFENELFARQDANSATCGWYDGDPTKPITCSHSTDGCAYYHNTPGGFGCCQYVGPSPATTACPYVSTCLNYADSSNSNSGNGVLWAPPSIACPSNAPYCITTKLSGSGGSMFYQYGCGATAATLLAYQTTNGITTTSSSSFLAPTPTSTLLSSMLATSTTSTSASASPTSSSSSGGLSGSATTGIGVGVGVGAGCLILGIAIGYYCLRRKRTSKESPITYPDDKTGHIPFDQTYSTQYSQDLGAHSMQPVELGSSRLDGKSGLNELSTERAPQELEAYSR